MVRFWMLEREGRCLQTIPHCLQKVSQFQALRFWCPQKANNSNVFLIPLPSVGQKTTA